MNGLRRILNMKYIRTQDGIFEFDKMIVPPRTSKSVFSRIIVGADTIEELCDCFIKIKRKGNCKPYILKFDYKDLPTLKEQKIKYKDSPVYGAILTDKGLIYVAKMNESGELELL